MKIGYIGASGLMGHGMAKNLLAKGQQVAITVHKQRDRVQDLLDAGATLAAIAQKLPELPAGSRVLGFNYDTGERYLSIEGFLPA